MHKDHIIINHQNPQPTKGVQNSIKFVSGQSKQSDTSESTHIGPDDTQNHLNRIN